MYKYLALLRPHLAMKVLQDKFERDGVHFRFSRSSESIKKKVLVCRSITVPTTQNDRGGLTSPSTPPSLSLN